VTVTDSRLELEAALSASGIRNLPQGQVAPPSTFIIPGSPNWLEPSVLGGGKRWVNWVIMCVVSVASQVAIEDQEQFADAVTSAIATLSDPWQRLPVINTPGFLMLAGLPYSAFRVDIRTVI
jgi:hypothetical protein